MFDKHVRKTKFHFSVGIFLLIATLISGIATFKSIPYFSYDFVAKELRYFQYSRIVDIYVSNRNVELTTAESVPVLVYHGLTSVDDSDKERGGEGINMPPELFFDQMLALKRDGWSTVSIYDFNDFLAGKKKLPEKSFLLTFDDGRKDSYYPADPILKALDFKATMFVIAGRSLSSRNMNSYSLSTAELQSMIKSGRWDIQSHGKDDHELVDIDDKKSKGHFLSNRLWNIQNNSPEEIADFKSRINTDLVDSKTAIEKYLDVKVVSFAFPFGDFGQDSVNFPESKSIILNSVKSVYPIAFYQIRGEADYSANYPGRDFPLVKRIRVSPEWSPNYLKTLLAGTSEKGLPFQDTFSYYNGWIKMWGFGSISPKEKIMSLGSGASSTGSLVLLDGSYLWKNYKFKSNISLVKGQTFSLFARYMSENDYVSCVFTPEYVRIVHMVNGQKELVIDNRHELGAYSENNEVSITVNGKDVICSVGEQMLVRQDRIENLPEHGGIGFETWDPEKNNSEIIVKAVQVEEIN